MSWTKLFMRIEIEGHAVRCLDRDEMAPFRPRLELEDIGEEFGRYPFVLRRDDRVIEFDTHLVLPSRFLILPRHGPKARRPGGIARSSVPTVLGRSRGRTSSAAVPANSPVSRV